MLASPLQPQLREEHTTMDAPTEPAALVPAHPFSRRGAETQAHGAERGLVSRSLIQALALLT